MTAAADYREIYRGHDKHKRRPTRGVKGTYCPEWTHEAEGRGVANDMYAHRWRLTRAQQLLEASVHDLRTGRRFTTGGGVAFEIKETNDGTYHGFPVPWDDVPSYYHDVWKRAGLVGNRQLKQYSEVGSAKDWAMESSDAS